MRANRNQVSARCHASPEYVRMLIFPQLPSRSCHPHRPHIDHSLPSQRQALPNIHIRCRSNRIHLGLHPLPSTNLHLDLQLRSSPNPLPLHRHHLHLRAIVHHQGYHRLGLSHRRGLSPGNRRSHRCQHLCTSQHHHSLHRSR